MNMKNVQCVVRNKASRDIGLYWKYCHTCAGEVFMGRTLAEAKKCAAETEWKK